MNRSRLALVATCGPAARNFRERLLNDLVREALDFVYQPHGRCTIPRTISIFGDDLLRLSARPAAERIS
jgi:hypothetical protein